MAFYLICESPTAISSHALDVSTLTEAQAIADRYNGFLSSEDDFTYKVGYRPTLTFPPYKGL